MVICRVSALGFFACFSAALALAAPAVAAPAVSGEFPVSGLDANNKIVQGPDGNVWLTVNSAAKDVASITPAGAVTEYDLGANAPSGIAADAEGRLWITREGGVTSFLPADPEGTKTPTAIAAIMSFHSIAFGPDGNLWVATSEKLILIPPANPAGFKEFAVAGLSPRDIDTAASLLAIADFGGKVVTATATDPPLITDFKINGGSQGVAGAPNGQVGFSQQGAAPTQIGLLTPPGAPLTTLSPETDPFGVAFGADGAFWIAQFQTASLTRLGSDNVATSLPGFAVGSGPRQIAAGPGSTLWVTLEKAKKVGRVSGVENAAPPAPSSTPETAIKGGPKGKVKTRRKWAKVKFRFQSPSAGVTFECRLKRLPRKPVAKATKAPRFVACKSPRSYRLKPGRYRFEVRAVLNGVADPTPVGRGFRIVRERRK